MLMFMMAIAGCAALGGVIYIALLYGCYLWDRRTEDRLEEFADIR